MRDFFRSPAHLDKAADWLTEHRLNQREPVTGLLLESTRLSDLITGALLPKMKARRKNFPGKTVPVLKRSAKIYSRRCIPLSCGSETRTRFSSGNGCTTSRSWTACCGMTGMRS